jgi:hypothetical protein
MNRKPPQAGAFNLGYHPAVAALACCTGFANFKNRQKILRGFAGDGVETRKRRSTGRAE